MIASMAKPGRAPWSKRLRADLEAGGLRHVIWHIGRKLASPVLEWGRLGFYARDLDGPLPDSPATPGLELRQASAEDLRRLVYAGKPVTAESLAERFRRGHLCFVAIDGDVEAAHARWVATDQAYIPELDSDVVLAAGEAYMYDGYTRPDARGSGIDGAIRCFIFRSLREAGFRRVYSYVRADNPVGVRAAQRWQRLAGNVRYLTPRGCRPLVWSGGGEHPRLAPGGKRQEQERAERAAALRASAPVPARDLRQAMDRADGRETVDRVVRLGLRVGGRRIPPPSPSRRRHSMRTSIRTWIRSWGARARRCRRAAAARARSPRRRTAPPAAAPASRGRTGTSRRCSSRSSAMAAASG